LRSKIESRISLPNRSSIMKRRVLRRHRLLIVGAAALAVACSGTPVENANIGLDATAQPADAAAFEASTPDTSTPPTEDAAAEATTPTPDGGDDGTIPFP